MVVYVYRNLNRKGVVYSLKAVDGPNKGRVLGYADHVVILDPKLQVSEAGRQRVIARKRKNVHAGIVGELLATDNLVLRRNDWVPPESPAINWSGIHENSTQVKYNPYKHPTFVTEHGDPVRSAFYATIFQRDVRVFSPRP